MIFVLGKCLFWNKNELVIIGNVCMSLSREARDDELMFLPRRVHLAQARVAETRPEVLRVYSLRWVNWFLSERPSCSGEMASPKRAPANSPRATVVVSPKRESVVWARVLLSLKRGRLAWARTTAGHAVFLCLVVMDCLINGSTLFKVWGLWNAWKSVVMKLDWCVGVILACEFIWDGY